MPVDNSATPAPLAADASRSARIAAVLPRHSGSAWKGLELKPLKVTFATQNEGEEILIFLRRHWLTNIGWVVNAALYAVLPWLFVVILEFFSLSVYRFLGIKLVTAILLIYYAYLFGYMLRRLIQWYFNIYIVTDQRIMEFDFQNFSNQKINELALDNVENVEQNVDGLSASFFGYGNVSIFSEAARSEITFVEIPNPTFVRDKVSDLSKIVKLEIYGE